MSQPRITDHYAKLGAKMGGVYGWGAVREDEGTVFLSVWMNEGKTIGGKSYYMVLRGNPVKITNGLRERVRHLDLIRQGAACYLTLCRPVNENADEKRIKTFDGAYLWRAGELKEHDGDLYIEELERIPTKVMQIK